VARAQLAQAVSGADILVKRELCCAAGRVSIGMTGSRAVSALQVIAARRSSRLSCGSSAMVSCSVAAVRAQSRRRGASNARRSTAASA